MSGRDFTSRKGERNESGKPPGGGAGRKEMRKSCQSRPGREVQGKRNTPKKAASSRLKGTQKMAQVRRVWGGSKEQRTVITVTYGEGKPRVK